MYLYVTDTLKIMVNVKDSNEVTCRSNVHYKKTCIQKDGQGNHLIRQRPILSSPCLLCLSLLVPELPLLMCNASALYSVLFIVV